MKPWQAKWVEFKRLNPNRMFIVCLIIFLCCAMVFFFMPSSKDVRLKKEVARLKKEEANLKSFVTAKKGRVATEAEVNDITSTNNVLVRKIENAPSLYLFVPSNNIAILGRLQNVRPGIDGYTVHLIPIPNHDSPTTEKAVGMCLLKNLNWNVSDLKKAAPNIRSSISKIDKLWSKVAPEDQAKIKTLMDANEMIKRKLGDLTVLVTDGKRSFLMQDWSEVSEIVDRLKEIKRSGG